MFTNAVLIIHCSIKTRLLSLSSLCFHNFNIYWPLLFLRFCSDQFVITTRSNHLCCKYFSRAHSATAVPLTQTMTFTRARTPLAVGLPGRILFSGRLEHGRGALEQSQRPLSQRRVRCPRALHRTDRYEPQRAVTDVLCAK